MSVHTDVTREIDGGPGGGKIGAFFDLDGTLVAGFSAVEFVRDGVVSGRMGLNDFGETLRTAARFQLGQVSFSAFVTGTAGSLRGRSEEEFREIGERIFRERLAASIYPESRALVEAHQRKGHVVCVVSAATPYQVEPLARDMSIEHVLCTKLEVKDGLFTGGIMRPTVYGEGKAEAVRKFARAHELRLKDSWFYTDSDEDLPLLDIVGKPRPTNPNRRLAEIAVKRGWPLRRFSSRGTPGVSEVLRTTLALGSMVPSFLLGLPSMLLDRSSRRFINIATATWGELGTAMAGVDLRVSGEQHLWSHRPAVFIFNHQSGIDVLLLCKMLRRDIVGIAKQELRANPIFGPAFAAAGTVFIDRFNREKAIEAMQPAVDALRRGLSIVIAPEGTRSPTPRLGRFKKGAFHLALAARAPLVPIVFRNALDALPKNGLIIRPATVEAVVHPPIPTATWKVEELDARIEEVRGVFERTLAE